MKTSIYASLFHVASSKKHSYHDHCMKGAQSWCAYQKHTAIGASSYKPGPGLPLKVIAELKPVYKQLSTNELLAKCLHGLTQNNNGSF